MHDRQAAALASFAALEAKAARLNRALASVEVEQVAALGELAHVAAVELAAELTGASTAKVREALVEHRRRNGGPVGSAAEEAAS